MGTALWVGRPAMLEDDFEIVVPPALDVCKALLVDVGDTESVLEPVCEPVIDCDRVRAFVLEPVCEPSVASDEAGEFVVEPVCEPVVACDEVDTSVDGGARAEILRTVLIAQRAALELELEEELELEVELFEALEETPAPELPPPPPGGNIGGGKIGGEIGGGIGICGREPTGSHANPPANITRGKKIPWLSLVVIVVCAEIDANLGMAVGTNVPVSVIPLIVAMTTDCVGVCVGVPTEILPGSRVELKVCDTDGADRVEPVSGELTGVFVLDAVIAVSEAFVDADIGLLLMLEVE